MASQQLTVQKFFVGKILSIPEYQRSYSWDKDNVRDLIEDIQESLETKANHYIGTVVLAETDKMDNYNIVDGQQRLTTILMIMNALILRLDNEEDISYYKRLYIFDEEHKIRPLERDKDYFYTLLEEAHTPEPKNRSQKYLKEVYEEIKNVIANGSINNKSEFLKALEKLQVLEFIEKDESDAIRIFQTVNDRGKDLTKMDKIKSLLFYFSNKYLEKKYDHIINTTFGDIFELYDNIKSIGEKQNINIIASKSFNEDDILRYHHICFSDKSYDPSILQVMEDVKSELIEHRNNESFEQLEAYIKNYLGSLLAFTKSFNEIIKKTETDSKYYKIFTILGLSAVYYPVVIQLEKLDVLDSVLPTKNRKTIDMIEIIDVRVFKIRGYAGKKCAGEFAHSLNHKNDRIDKIEEHLLWFNSFEIDDNRFKDLLTNSSYYENTGLLRLLFIDYCEMKSGELYSINELKEIMSEYPTIEHILSQTPKFQPSSYGFENEEDFNKLKGMIGNLTILEKKINSSIKNKDLVEKIKGYDESTFLITKRLSASIASSKVFNKKDLNDRTKTLTDELSIRWWA